MEQITQLKEKHLKIDTSELKHLLLSQLETIDEIKKHQNQEFNENDIKIKELTSKLDFIKETLYTETQNLELKNDELLKYNHHLDEIKIEKNEFLKKIKQLEGKRNSLKCAKRNSQDQQVLQQGKKKLKLYTDLTRIHWDYEASQHSIKGYVTNKTDYIRYFCYTNEQINNKLTDSLWHEIYLSTCKAEDRDENL